MGYWFSIDKGSNTETILDRVATSTSVADQIKQIRDALEINTETAKIDYDDLRSIPDIWTTHRIYDMMLFGPEDGAGADVVLKKYKEAVIKNWRAIMAVLLIGKAFYGLNIEKMEITPDIMQDPQGMLGNNRDFMRSIFEARPKNVVWRDQRAPYNPNIVAVYYLHKGMNMLPIAVSSPTTLAVPTADAWKHLYGLIDWIDEKTDSDGNKKHFVPDDFLEKLDYSKALALSEALQAESELPLDIIDQRKAAVLQTLLNGYLNDPTILKKTQPISEQALLKETLYFFSGQIKTTTPDENDPVLGGIDKSCYFIDPAQHGADDDRYFNYYYLPMPITELCLKLIKQSRVTYSIRPNLERGALKSVAVTITPTSSDDTRRIIREFGTEYALKEIRLFEQISTVAIWPRQEIEGWSSYYAFRYDVSLTDAENSEADIHVSARRIERYVLEPLIYNNFYDITGKNGQLHRYYKMDMYPAFWSFQLKTETDENTVGYIRSRKEKIPAANIDNIYTLAIDFGTSSTMLYRTYSGVNTKEYVPGNVFWSTPICNPERHENDQLVNCFIPATPPRQVGMPYQTLLAVAEGHGSADPDALFGRWIFFRSVANAKSAKMKIGQTKIKSDLKWSAADPVDTQRFLQETIFLAALDARLKDCGTIRIIASYPGSMLEAKINGYVQSLNQIKERVAEKTKLRINEIELVTESLAVAKGIRARTNFGLDFCSIDIGGGTSDIFLCYKPSGENTEWQGLGSSMKIGARDIFLDCFWMNRNLIQDILDAGANVDLIKKLQTQYRAENPSGVSGQSLLTVADLAKAQLTRNQLHSLIESLLEYNVDVDGRFISAANSLMSISANNSKASIVNMRLRIAYYIAAITYYAGMLARIQDPDGNTLRVDRLEIRFVGNGSKAIHWISEDTRAIREFIKTMFQTGMKQADKPNNVGFSAEPKHEVAFGALVDDGRLDCIQQDNLIIAGERFIERGASTKEATCTMPQLATGSRFRPEHTELKTFLDAFNKAILNIIPNVENCVRYVYPESQEEGFINKVEDMMIQLVRRNEEKKPFFLMGVEIVDPLNNEIK